MKGFFKNECPNIELFVEDEKIAVEIDTGFSDYLMIVKLSLKDQKTL